MASILGAGIALCGSAMALSMAADECNDLYYMSQADAIQVNDPMNGHVQPLFPPSDNKEEEGEGEGEGEEEETPFEKLRKPQPEDGMWRNSPHVQAIRRYGLTRPGFFSLYWCYSPTVLHTLYFQWLRTVPSESPLHTTGRYAETFVELHRSYFMTGLTGRICKLL